MSKFLCMVCWGLLLVGVGPVAADQYWVDYEASSGALPEDSGQGWHRVWGDWQGLHHGTGADRNIEDGLLTYDSLYDNGVYDLNEMARPIDPGPGELFVMEWRLRVDQVVGWTYDPAIYAISDGHRGVDFAFRQNAFESVYEGHVSIPITPATFHDYRLTSWDMVSYDLSVDNVVVRHGSFMPVVNQSYLGWGDGVQGAASLHHWEYIRVSVVPEPGTLIVLGAVLACRVRTRR